MDAEGYQVRVCVWGRAKGEDLTNMEDPQRWGTRTLERGGQKGRGVCLSVADTPFSHITSLDLSRPLSTSLFLLGTTVRTQRINCGILERLSVPHSHQPLPSVLKTLEPEVAEAIRGDDAVGCVLLPMG